MFRYFSVCLRPVFVPRMRDSAVPWSCGPVVPSSFRPLDLWSRSPAVPWSRGPVVQCFGSSVFRCFSVCLRHVSRRSAVPWSRISWSPQRPVLLRSAVLWSCVSVVQFFSDSVFASGPSRPAQPSRGPVVLWSFISWSPQRPVSGLWPPAVPWSRGPVVLWSCGPLVPYQLVATATCLRFASAVP